jgi:hypothetical protein
LVYLLIDDEKPVTFSSSVSMTLLDTRSYVPSGEELDSIDKSRSVARLGVCGDEDRVVRPAANLTGRPPSAQNVSRCESLLACGSVEDIARVNVRASAYVSYSITLCN